MTNTKLLVMYAMVGAALSAAMVSYLDPTSELSKSPIPTASAAQVDMFLQIEGINGESTDDATGTGGWIQVDSWSWGATNPGTSADTKTGAAAGKVSHSDFTITKTIDSTSPKLYEDCAAGQHFPSVTIEVANPNNHQEYWKITLTDVIISSFKAGGSNENPTESVSFTYEKIQFEYNPPPAT
jgi:type VI secretion system secreted protein Hcp